MGMIEKKSLIDSITIELVEKYDLPIKEVKAQITEILQQYHVSISDDICLDSDTSTIILMNKFKQGKLSIGMSEKTLNQYEIAVSILEKYTNKKLCDIEPEDINNFLKRYSEDVSSVTVRAKYQLLSSVYNYLFTHRFIPFNPILYVDVPKVTTKYKKPMTDMDLEKIKTICERLPEKESIRDMALVYFMTSTGCRVSEIANVKLKDVDIQNKICKVLGKGRKERPVILNDKCIYRLKLYMDQRQNLSPDSPLFARIRGAEVQMTKDGIERIINKICAAAKVKDITCHSFRRYYATELRKRNVNIQMIASSLGHANLNQINRYSVYSNNEMLNVIRASM